MSLDDQKRVLKADDVVITNGKEVIASAGVMGLANTMIDDDTRSVILEAAYFEPKRIQKTSRRLDLRSDSSLRFERGIDDERVMLGLEVRITSYNVCYTKLLRLKRFPLDVNLLSGLIWRAVLWASLKG